MTEELDRLNQPYDAQQLVEEIAEGEKKAPAPNLDADYEAAQAYSISEVDRTEAGTQAAAAATSTKHQLSEPEETSSEAKPTGNPEDYLQMARETNPYIAE